MRGSRHGGPLGDSGRPRPLRRRQPPGITVLYEDASVLVVDKAPGLLTIATERDRERTAYRLLTDYVRAGQGRSRNRVFIVHRLDRDTSGLLVFARTEAAKRRLQEHWQNTRKVYWAVVHGRPARAQGTIESYLVEDAAYRVHSTRDRSAGRLARTEWRVLRTARGLSLLEIRLLTGRKHQIRVHLAEAGHPVVGDRKYGRAGDAHRPLALHAQSLAFDHPETGERLQFEAPAPAHFARLMGPAVLQGTTPPRGSDSL